MTAPTPEPEGPFPINPVSLLDHARLIIDVLPEPGETEYRRAVSAAYFALFHAVTLRAVGLPPSGDAPAQRYEAVRAIGHSHVRNVALWTSGMGTPPHAVASRAMMAREDGPSLQVATAILLLNDERRHADYDHLDHFTLARANRAVHTANQAVATIMAPAFGTRDGGRAFLRMLAEQLGARPPA